MLDTAFNAFEIAQKSLSDALWILSMDEKERAKVSASSGKFHLTPEQHQSLLEQYQASLAIQRYYAISPNSELVDESVANPTITIEEEGFKCRALLASYEGDKDSLTKKQIKALNKLLFGDALFSELKLPPEDIEEYQEPNGCVLISKYAALLTKHELTIPESLKLRRLAADTDTERGQESPLGLLLCERTEKDEVGGPFSGGKFRLKGHYCIGEHPVTDSASGITTFFNDFLGNNKLINGQSYPHFVKWLAEKTPSEPPFLDESDDLYFIQQWLSENKLSVDDILCLENTVLLVERQADFIPLEEEFEEWLTSIHGFQPKHIGTIKHHYTQDLENPLKGVMFQNISSSTPALTLRSPALVNYTVEDDELIVRGLQYNSKLQIMGCVLLNLELPGFSMTELRATDEGFRVETLWATHPIHLELVTQQATFYDIEIALKVLNTPNLSMAKAALNNIVKKFLTEFLSSSATKSLTAVKKALAADEAQLDKLLPLLIECKQHLLEELEGSQVVVCLELFNAYVSALLKREDLADGLLDQPQIKRQLQELSPFAFAMQSEQEALWFLQLDEKSRDNPSHSGLKRFQLHPSEHARLLLHYQESLAVQNFYAQTDHKADIEIPDENFNPKIVIEDEAFNCRALLEKLAGEALLSPNELAALQDIIFGDALLPHLTTEEKTRQTRQNIRFALASYDVEKLALIFEKNNERSQAALAATMMPFKLPEDMTTKALIEHCRAKLPQSVAMAIPEFKRYSLPTKKYQWKAKENSTIDGGLNAFVVDWVRDGFIIHIDGTDFRFGDFSAWYETWEEVDKPIKLSPEAIKEFFKIKLTEKGFNPEQIAIILLKIDKSFSQGFIGREPKNETLDESLERLASANLSLSGKGLKLSLHIAKSGRVSFEERQTISFSGDIADIFIGDLAIPGEVSCRGEFTVEGALVRAAAASSPLLADLVLPLPAEEMAVPHYKGLLEEGESAKQAAERLTLRAKYLQSFDTTTSEKFKSVQALFHDCLCSISLFQTNLTPCVVGDLKQLTSISDLDTVLLNSKQTLTREQHRYFLDKYGSAYVFNRIRTAVPAVQADPNLFASLTSQEVSELLSSSLDYETKLGKIAKSSEAAMLAIFANPDLGAAILKSPRKFGLRSSKLPNYDKLKDLHLDNWAFQYRLAKRYSKPLPEDLGTQVNKGFFRLGIKAGALEGSFDELSADNLALTQQKYSNSRSKIADVPENFWRMVPALTDKELMWYLDKAPIQSHLSDILKLGLRHFTLGDLSLEDSAEQKAFLHIATRLRANPDLSKLIYKQLVKSYTRAQSEADRETHLEDLTNLASLDSTGQLAKRLLSKTFWTWPSTKRVRAALSEDQQSQLVYAQGGKPAVRETFKKYHTTSNISERASKGAEAVKIVCHSGVVVSTNLRLPSRTDSAEEAVDMRTLDDGAEVLEHFIQSCSAEGDATQLKLISLEQMKAMLNCDDKDAVIDVLNYEQTRELFRKRSDLMALFKNFVPEHCSKGNEDLNTAYSKLIIDIVKDLGSTIAVKEVASPIMAQFLDMQFMKQCFIKVIEESLLKTESKPESINLEAFRALCA